MTAGVRRFPAAPPGAAALASLLVAAAVCDDAVASAPLEQDAATARGATFRDRLRDGSHGPEMVVVPADTYRMGEGAARSDGSAQRAHAVTLARPFSVSRFEVTFAEYERFARATGRSVLGQGDDDRSSSAKPVTSVSWDDADAYASWLAGETGERYRLLSEAEWEYAARAGSPSAYSFGDDPADLCVHANTADAAFRKRYPQLDYALSCNDGHADTAPAGSFRANVFGLHDFHGNVSEWVQDCWHESYEGAPADGSAWLDGECGSRVQRGGSYFDGPLTQRSATRHGTWHDYRETDIGLRIARDF
jgi:formylglycine-generating enzyme required for sulfatase activity